MKIVILLVSFLLDIFMASSVTAETFCALRIIVTTEGGDPIFAGEAQLVGADGSIVQVAKINAGRGEFCDFGFGPHSVRVSGNGMRATTVSGIVLTYGKTLNLRVVMNVLKSSDGGGGGNACSAYLRVQTTEGKPISGARVTAVSARGRVKGIVCDEYGRALLLVPTGEFVAYRAEDPGFRPTQFTLSCSTWDESLERTVTLFASRP